MPRQRQNAIFPIACSPARAADALCIREVEMYEAIRLGHVPVYRKGARSFVLIEDLTKWVRTWPLTTLKRRRKRHVESQSD